MSDFDITNVHSKTSFLASLKKRKAFGLIDSDSEDESELFSRKKARNIGLKTSIEEKPKDLSESSSPSNLQPNTVDITDDTDSQTVNEHGAEESVEQPVVNPYLTKNPELELLKQQLSAPRKTPSFMSSSPSASFEADTKLNFFDETVPDDDDIEDLDPDVKALLQQSTPEIEPQKITIRLQYTHDFKNLSDRAKMVIDKLMKPIKIIVMDNTQFRVILDNFCLRKKLKKDELVLVYNDDVVFLSATPGGIGMDTIGTNQMKVYPKTCYDSMMKEKEEKKLERLRKLEMLADEEFDFSFKTESPSEPAAAETEEVNEQKIRLQLRDKENKCFPVTISLSKKLEALIQFYKKQTGCSTNVNLSLDGEIMDSSMMINETDLEDEDMIDVVQA